MLTKYLFQGVKKYHNISQKGEAKFGQKFERCRVRYESDHIVILTPMLQRSSEVFSYEKLSVSFKGICIWWALFAFACTGY
jgi:hypothetical protein